MTVMEHLTVWVVVMTGDNFVRNALHFSLSVFVYTVGVGNLVCTAGDIEDVC